MRGLHRSRQEQKSYCSLLFLTSTTIISLGKHGNREAIESPEVSTGLVSCYVIPHPTFSIKYQGSQRTALTRSPKANSTFHTLDPALFIYIQFTALSIFVRSGNSKCLKMKRRCWSNKLLANRETDKQLN